MKDLQPDEQLVLPDGTALIGRDVLGETRRGRKLVVLGDCCDARECDELSAGASGALVLRGPLKMIQTIAMITQRGKATTTAERTIGRYILDLVAYM